MPYVCDICRVVDFPTQRQRRAIDQVCGDERAKITYVRVGIDRRATGVEGQMILLSRLDRFNRIGQCVLYAELPGHGTRVVFDLEFWL